MLTNLLKNKAKNSGFSAPVNIAKQAPIKKVLNVADVRVGDLVFYETLVKGLDAGTVAAGSGSVHHVEICTQGGQVSGEVRITSQVNLGENKERGFQELKHTRSTTLKPQNEDRLVVLRCQNEELRVRAAKYAEHWCKLVIAFNRRNTAMNPKDHDVKKHRSNFRETGRFRAIRYAARRSGDLQLNGDEPKPTKGMFCSHFVVACYQVAGIDKFVKAAGPNVKVQDKKGKITKEQIPEQYRGVIDKYKHYQEADNSNDCQEALAGIVFWQFEQPGAGDIETFEWNKHITEGMKVDSKKIMPSALLASLVDDQAGWDTVGAIMPSAD